MESLRGDMLEGMPAETEELLPVGSRATVDGLKSRSDLNGREAEIQSWLPQKGRCVRRPPRERVFFAVGTCAVERGVFAQVCCAYC